MIVNLEALFSERILALPVLLFSIVLHEFSHAYMAYRAGDMTAAAQGRLTLNPLVHLDPVGTVLIPILQFLYQGLPLIGWARPVPVNPLKFRSSEWDIFVSLAGPGSNLLLAITAAILLKIGIVTGLVSEQALLGVLVHAAVKPELIGLVLFYFIEINIALGLFNLIPIPPLDGSRVVYRFLASARSPLADAYAALERYGYIILILIIVSPVGNFFFGIIYYCQSLVMRLIF